ncbi:MAG: 2-oxo acid dehydrogenase subunit E2 [Verrucomicrobiota bacterium]|nr:2-oxo acid dehydrogenase subunit E2 [Verrucomicrobiota bacterium]
MRCDHRVIDGALGAEYVQELRHFLENPTLVLI